MELGIIALLIIQSLILLLINNLANSKESSKNNKDEEKNFKNGINQGINQTCFTVQISLFKMWQEMDIIDFDSLYLKLLENLDKLTKNSNEFEKWNEKFIEYVKNMKAGD